MTEEVKVEQVLMAADNVRLLRIPPPTEKQSRTTRDGLYDVSAWDWGQVVWTGRLQLTSSEIINDGIPECAVARVDLINSSSRMLFGSVQCDQEGENIRQTHSRRAFRVLINSQDKKVALGLVFEDSSTANDFVGSLKRFKRDQQEMAGLEGDVARIKLDRPEAFAYESAIDDDDDDDGEDDEDFGDFVTA